MKLNILELRDMVAQAVRQTMREAKKAKLPAERSEESVIAQRDRQVRGLPGFAHSKPLDMSKPLGKRSRTKRQGASNIGNWTSEAAFRHTPASADPVTNTPSGQRERFIQVMVSNGVDPKLAKKIASQAIVDSGDDMGDPGQLGIDDRGIQERAIRKLVGMVVDEEVRVRRYASPEQPRFSGPVGWLRKQGRRLDTNRGMAAAAAGFGPGNSEVEDDPRIPMAVALPPRGKALTRRGR